LTHYTKSLVRAAERETNPLFLKHDLDALAKAIAKRGPVPQDVVEIAEDKYAKDKYFQRVVDDINIERPREKSRGKGLSEDVRMSMIEKLDGYKLPHNWMRNMKPGEMTTLWFSPNDDDPEEHLLNSKLIVRAMQELEMPINSRYASKRNLVAWFNRHFDMSLDVD
jgi:hypothetical protein